MKESGIIVNFSTRAVAPRRHSQTQGMQDLPDPAVTNWIRSEALGQLIRATRRRRHLSPAALNARGVCLDPSSLYRIESGEKAVEYQTLRQIAAVLHEPQITAYASERIIAQLDPVRYAEGLGGSAQQSDRAAIAVAVKKTIVSSDPSTGPVALQGHRPAGPGCRS